MTRMGRDVSVVICTYTEDRWDNLVAAVASVQRQTMPPREIVVVVDHNDHLLKRVRAHIGGVIAVENLNPPGDSGARNSGVATAQGTLIAFLDDDATAALDWLERLTEGYEDRNVMGIGGMLEPVWLGGRPTWFPAEFNWVVGCSYSGLPPVTSPIRNLIAANMSFRRDIFPVIGGFRAELARVGTRPVGCHETELCIRVHQRRPQEVLLHEPRARVYHRVPAWRASWRYFRDRCFAEGYSKALLSQYVGVRDALSSERTYVVRILGPGVARGVADALLHADLAGAARAGAIVGGVAFATAGYLMGVVFAQFTMLGQAANGSFPAAVMARRRPNQVHQPIPSVLRD